MFEEVENICIKIIIFCVIQFLITILLKLRSKSRNRNSKQNDIVFAEKLKEFYPIELFDTSQTKLLSLPAESLIINESDEHGINLVKVNYLNMLNNKEIQQIAIESIYKYGIGTCGPRAFYGTTEVHLELESALAKFLGMEEAIIYSYGFAAPSNAIPAYCKKIDVIFCDEKINFAITQGLLASKSILVYFKHNNVIDLHHKLLSAFDTNSPLCKLCKFLIVEGIYWKTGTLCPLLDLLKLAKVYKLRVFIDESISFGVLGKTGRGITEHFGINRNEIDLIIGSLEGALGSIGSFCAGSKSIIEHQRLSSAGYIFSASLPTFLVQAGLAALNIIENNPEEVSKLQFISEKVHAFLQTSSCYIVQGHSASPYKIFNYKIKENRHIYEQEICNYSHANGVYLIATDLGLIMHLNVLLYYQNSKLLNVFAVLDSAANNVIH